MTSASSVAPAVVPERPARGGPPGAASPGDDFAAILQTTARTAPAEGQTPGEPLENGSAEPETAPVVPVLPALPATPAPVQVSEGEQQAAVAAPAMASGEVAAANDVALDAARSREVRPRVPGPDREAVGVAEGREVPHGPQRAAGASSPTAATGAAPQPAPAPATAPATAAKPAVAVEAATPATPATPTSNAQPVQPATPASPAQSAAQPTPVLLADRLERVHALVQLAQSGGTATARLELHPLDLGRVDVLLRSSAEGVVATVAAKEPATVEVLQQAGADLRRSLEDRGVTVARIDLQLGAQGDERREAHGAHPGADGRSRSVVAVEGDEPPTPDPTTTATTVGIRAGALVDVHA